MATNNNNTFKYQMLSRLQMDCDYYLGNGNRHTKFLWADNEKDHIQEMKDIYNSLDKKPEWLTWEEILQYEKRMTNT
jgi:hypothetical protein